MPKNIPAVQLLQAEVDEDNESHFRFLCNGHHVTYVTIATGIYTADDMCFAPVLIPLLPPFPPGDWNDGYIARDPKDGTPCFVRAAKLQLPGVRSAWHSTHLNHLDLTYGKKLRSNVYEATTPSFSCTIVAKFARFAWEIDYLESECLAYQWIEGRSIGPKFLGHLVEEGRVIGFIMENITGARHATPNDLAICQEKVSSLHQVGILHGDVNKFNFLIRGKHAMILDFDSARKCDDAVEFEKELQCLAEQFSDTSGRGGSIEDGIES